MNIDYDAILKTIVDGNTRKDTSNKNILKTDIIGNTIIGRFVPNFNDVEHSLFAYFHHGWTSLSDGVTSIFHVCLNTYKEKCPDCKRSAGMWKSKNTMLMETSKKIRRRSNTMANFYIISDLKHPENNGTVKIFRFGKQIKDKIDMAITGDDKNIYGPKIWRLDEQGCNFRIKCEQNSESSEAWPTYTNSSFLPASKIDDMTEEKIAQIHKSVFDLAGFYPRKTFDEMVADLNKHFLVNEVITINSNTPTTNTGSVSVEPLTQPSTPIVQPQIAQPIAKESAVSSAEPIKKNTLNEDQVDAMLKELQDMAPKPNKAA